MDEPNETHEITPAPEAGPETQSPAPATQTAIPATSNKQPPPLRGVHGQPLK